MTQLLTKNTDLLRQEVHEHIAADAVIQGSYWADGKGCFISCLTHCDDPAPAVERFGLTEPILRIAERIFESLPLEEAKAFFCEFPSAVGCDNKDLSLVHWKFLAETLRNLPPQHPEIQDAIDPIINGMDLLGSGGIWEWAAAKDALWAAGDAAWNTGGAAWDAWLAARAAFWAASFSLMPNSARTAANAAWNAARAAGFSCRLNSLEAAAKAVLAPDVAAATETRRQRDSLLRLIREAPVATPS